MFLNRLFGKKESEKEKVLQSSAAQINNDLLDELSDMAVPVDSTIEIIADKNNLVSIIILLSYIRHYLNSGKSGDIHIKIGYNKPPTVPFNFSVNEQTVDDIYPGETLEIN